MSATHATRFRKTFLLAFAASLAAFALGCGYRFGSLANPAYHTVAVPMFRNTTLYPQLQAQVTNAVLRKIQADGSLRVTSESDADLVLEGVIVDVNREPLRFEKISERVPRENRLTLVVTATLRDRKSGKVVFKDARFVGKTDYFIGTDLQAAEMQAAPLAAEDLARALVPRITEGW